jgi:hypothetical protein
MCLLVSVASHKVSSLVVVVAVENSDLVTWWTLRQSRKGIAQRDLWTTIILVF